MDCRKPTAIEFKTKLGFTPHDLIITKEQSVLTKTMKVFVNEEILLWHSALSYRLDLYFPRYRLAIQVDEKGQKDRNKYKEAEKKGHKQHLDCKLIRVSSGEKDFDIYVEIGKIYNHVNRSSEKLSKKSLIDRLSSQCAACSSKKSRFLKEQEEEVLLSISGIKTVLSNIPV